MRRKFYLWALFLIVLLFVIPPLLAPAIHNDTHQKSAIRKYLVKEGHPYQSFVARMTSRGRDQDHGERYEVTWHDFSSDSGMTPAIFYVKKNKKGYYVESAGTGP
ncbi:hypothetical protein [Fictibacillus terranigra]|uniref:DUF3139 domain-containing protein n=1 Tax=Fictibacillus terranigra TaxID=3058424 RepID=A0ABT8E1U1_9BACL|nr:hypothetical protein [Fictibacillus sp. CENA-BCM004]MDN4071865.1 hypothetical protein [Fictibacillus sp. CENA-BCM004]